MSATVQDLHKLSAVDKDDMHAFGHCDGKNKTAMTISISVPSARAHMSSITRLKWMWKCLAY